MRRRSYLNDRKYKFHIGISPVQGESYNIVFQDAINGGGIPP